MITIHKHDSDSQFSCTDSQFTWRCCMLMYDGLMIWGFPSADLGIWSASVSFTETFGVATCILLTRPQWSSSYTFFEQLRFGAEWTRRQRQVSRRWGWFIYFPPSYSVKVNRWLPQFSTYSEWQYHGMAQCMNIKMSISEQAGLEKALTQLVGCRFGWLIAGYLMLFGQLHHFQGQQPVHDLGWPPAHIRGEVFCFLECWKSCGAGGVSWAGVEITPQDPAAFFFGSLVSLGPYSGWLENCRLMKW